MQSSVIDKNFQAALQQQSARSYVKGRADFPHLRGTDAAAGSDKPEQRAGNDAASRYGSAMSLDQGDQKPWRTAQKKEKKEKLRKKFLHLDQH